MTSSTTETSFRKVLNSHGYAFQFGLASELEYRFLAKGEPWRVIGVEVPVEVQGYTTRIDFVLANSTRNVWLAAECKRANPALSNWCFAASPNLVGGSRSELIGERLRFIGAGLHSVECCGGTIGSMPNIYDVAIEVRGSEKGDPNSIGHGAIEASMTQVVRGMNGLIRLAEKNRSLIVGTAPQTVSGIVFTTAEIWTSNVALDRTDLATGVVDFEGSEFVARPWVAYRYRATPNLRHEFPCGEVGINLQEVLDRDFVRTIFVVGPSGVSPFLEWAATAIG